jgi:hypothetical protein
MMTTNAITRQRIERNARRRVSYALRVALHDDDASTLLSTLFHIDDARERDARDNINARHAMRERQNARVQNETTR